MEKKTGELLFVLEDQKKALERLFTANPEFKKKFTSRLELPVFINDELVTFGRLTPRRTDTSWMRWVSWLSTAGSM